MMVPHHIKRSSVKTSKIYALALCAFLFGCKESTRDNGQPQVEGGPVAIGAMRQVMWEGKLEGQVSLDTLVPKKGLYGLGPESYLTGELLIDNGVVYVSRVTSDSTMVVEPTSHVSAPFFVYAHVDEWRSRSLPDSVKTQGQFEHFLDLTTKGDKRPFAFKLEGEVQKAVIHVQNLPEGTTVSSPQQAHQGQTDYNVTEASATIIGFFSTEHQGVYTHHDSFVHMHLITEDKQLMGHLDEASFGAMTLYLPEL
jgi:acetolactate decarboxylase